MQMLILQKLKHSHIISLYDYDIINDNVFWSLNDYCNLGSLTNLFDKKSNFNINVVKVAKIEDVVSHLFG